MSNPTARTLARRVAQELGQPTNHPGTARLARDLAEPLPIRHQYRWTVEEWKNGGWVRCESVFTWSARSKSFARASVVKNAPAMRRARFRVHSPVDVGVPEGMELDPSPVRGTGWPSWRVEDHAGEYANVARDLADARLIAAAPDLLAACRGVLEDCPPYVDMVELQVSRTNYNLLRAAIAKAQGPTP